MAVTKRTKGEKVHHKNLHGDSGRAIGLKGRSAGLRAVYKRLENRPVLFPVTRAPNGRVLSEAVIAVVEPKK